VALITTEGNRAIDVFYLTQEGARLSGEAQQELRQGLLGALGPVSERSEA